MKVLEIYTYERSELDKTKFINVNSKGDIKYITENSITNLPSI